MGGLVLSPAGFDGQNWIMAALPGFYDHVEMVVKIQGSHSSIPCWQAQRHTGAADIFREFLAPGRK